MKLTPLDIRKHEFARRLRGYDPEEVRPFLEMLSQQWDEALEELRGARDRVRELEGKIAHYEKVEEALQEALHSAKAGAQRTQAHAEDRARLIVEEAELRAEQILQDAEQDRFKLRQDVSRLTHRHAEVTARLRHFLMSELEILAQHEEDRPVGFMKLIPAREAEALPEPQERQSPGASEAAAPEHPPVQQVSPPDPEEADSASSPPDGDAGTTYADLYARASRRTDDFRLPPEEVTRQNEEDDADFDEGPEPAWNLRQIVGEGDDEDYDLDRTAPRRSDRDQIRRIIEDLD